MEHIASMTRQGTYLAAYRASSWLKWKGYVSIPGAAEPGGCSDTNPEFSSWTAGERITEANSTGANALVTACPWCESNLKDAVDENGRKNQGTGHY